MDGSIGGPPAPPSRAPLRLGAALCLSLAAHAWFAFGLRVVPPRQPPGPGGSLQARLNPLAGEKVTALPAEPPRPVATAPVPSPRATPVSASPAAPTTPPPPSEPPVVPRDRDLPPLPGQGADAPPAPERAAPGPALELPQVEDPEFYPARKLDVLPRPLAEVVLRYPEAAGEQSGRVTLLLLIDELGMVVDITVIDATPAGVFEEAAAESFRHVMFAPAVRNGRAVKSRLPVEVTFDARTESMRPPQ